MAAGPWIVYDNFMLEKSNGTQDLSATGDDFYVILLDSGYTPATTTDATYAGINGDELTTANGYTVGGDQATPSLTKTAGNIKFSLTDVSWAVVTATITAHYAVIRNDTTGGLVGYCLLDSTDADVTIEVGNTLSIDISTNAVYNEARQ